MNAPYVCTSCRQGALAATRRHASRKISRRPYTRPSFAPKPVLDLKHIRHAPGLYEQNCIDRNYAPQARNSWRILELHEKLVAQRREVVKLRQRNNAISKEVGRSAAAGDGDVGEARTALLDEARGLKQQLSGLDAAEKEMQEEMERLALELPNLSPLHTPVGEDPRLVVPFINELPSDSSQDKSHVEIGKQLDILDFEASATTSGYGWYFLKNEGALLEQALIQYALSVAMKRGWRAMTPPSLVYSHIANACGFMPRDQNGETQVYSIAQQEHEKGSERPGLVLTGTAEIPFAGTQANRTLSHHELPMKVIGPSRCYRAEAGARGVGTKGLYRVHEFTKVEMFAWTLPGADSEGDRFGEDEDEDEDEDDLQSSQSDEIFEEMIDIQREILASLGLHARVLEMPTSDLGASATRKIDIEAFFPSRQQIDFGYGEVTSASICTDYQARRLGTRLKNSAGKLVWPYTVNGTAMAIPRVLACILENHWDEAAGVVQVPEVLRQYMPGNIATIQPPTKSRK